MNIKIITLNERKQCLGFHLHKILENASKLMVTEGSSVAAQGIGGVTQAPREHLKWCSAHHLHLVMAPW